MANSSKSKGDKAERDAVEMLKARVPDLCLPKAKRMLGAGRSEDVGDLYVFPDVAIQVRAYKMESIGAALRSSAIDSVTQAGHGDMDFAMGLVPYPRAREDQVRWIATGLTWPEEFTEDTEPIDFAMVSKALTWVRDDNGPYGYRARPRHQRIARLGGGATTPILLAPVEAWLSAYRVATGRHEPIALVTPIHDDVAADLNVDLADSALTDERAVAD
jgi:hypothetical protein